MSTLSRLSAVVLAVLPLLSAHALEDAKRSPARTLTVKVTSTLVSTEYLPAGDEDGHVIGLGQRDGEATFEDGASAKYANAYTFDARRGHPAAVAGYTRFLFADGSRIVLSWTAESGPGPDGRGHTQGKGTILKGTGRFAGIQGTATFTGVEPKPAAEDPKRTILLDSALTFTLPMST